MSEEEKIDYREKYKDGQCPWCKGKLIFNEDGSNYECPREDCLSHTHFSGGKIVAMIDVDESLYKEEGEIEEQETDCEKIDYREKYKDGKCPWCNGNLIFNEDGSKYECPRKNCLSHSHFSGGKIVATIEDDESLYII